MANPYYESSELLRAKNLAAGGAALSFPNFALSRCELGKVNRGLDVGCGWGRFAVPLLEQAPQLSELCCTDLWPGAVSSCRSTLGSPDRVRYAVADVRALPFPDASFDLVMANHMLYELEDVSDGVSEVARVLRRDGQLLATTYSDSQRIPMTELHFRTMAAIGHPYPSPSSSSFSFENGESLLGALFESVKRHVMAEQRSVTDPEPFRDQYLLTGGYHWASRDESIPPEARGRIPETFLELAGEWIAAEGAITWETWWTAFVSKRPRSRTLPIGRIAGG